MNILFTTWEPNAASRGGHALTLIVALLLSVPAAAQIPLSDACRDNNGDADSFGRMFTCGSISGSARAFYYTTHNAYFSRGFDQDTISYGGFLTYQSARWYGFQLGGSGIFLRGIHHPDRARVINDIGPNQTNIGEAWLSWSGDGLRITGGNQRLNLPFVGDYDWRITPMLYQALDVQYGGGDDFLHVTKIWRFKSFGSERQQRTTNYTEVNTKTNGMWSLGAGHHVMLGNEKLSGQAWYQHYNDFSNIWYTEGHLSWPQARFAPDVGVQYIRGTSAGRALAGPVNSTSLGAQLALSLTRSLRWQLGYDHIGAAGHSYGYGSLVTPYAHNVASGPYFAQPSFTSTQDLGSGNAWSTNLDYRYSPSLTFGGRYSWMDLTPTVNSGSRRQSEYIAYFSWHFQGALDGLTLTDYLGVQTSPLYGSDFWQNRLSLDYSF